MNTNCGEVSRLLKLDAYCIGLLGHRIVTEGHIIYC
jgi:hypothetical protein